MAQGDLTTRGKCNACGGTIAWRKEAAGWRLCSAATNEQGEVERVTVKNGKGRTVQRPLPAELHTCVGVERGILRVTPRSERGVPTTPPSPSPGGWQPTAEPATVPVVQAPVVQAEPIDYGRIRREVVTILDEYGVKPEPQTIAIQAPGEAAKPIEGIVHPAMARLIQLTARRRHSYAFGPAGTGKTHAGGQAAAVLGLRSAVVSMPGITSAARLFGFETAVGKLVETVLFDYWVNGGVIIADEFDRGIPQVNSSLNSCLANGRAVFGGKSYNAHADFVLLANGNTDMRGATLDYTAAQPQDYATAARFAFIPWENDLVTETKLVAAIIGHGPAERLIGWLENLRAAVTRAAMEKILCGPRESMQIAADLITGASLEVCLDSWVRRGLDSDAWDALMADAGRMPEIAVTA